jgi:hypothetical protein
MKAMNVPVWGPGSQQIYEGVFLCFEGMSQAEREDAAEGIAEWVRAQAKGNRPPMRTSPFQREEHAREGWARMVAYDLIGVALLASERSPSDGTPAPSPDQQAMLREIATLALWHMKNAPAEARELVRIMEIERLKQPHRGDPPPAEVS